MSDKHKGSDYSNSPPFHQNAPFFERTNRHGSFPPHSVPNPYQPPYPGHPPFPQFPHSSQSNPRQPLYQIPRDSGYNPQGYGYAQPSTSADYEYQDYGSYNNQDFQFSGHSHQNTGFNTPSPYTDYSMVQSTYSYSHQPLVTDITRPPSVFSDTYDSSYQASTTKLKDTGYVSNTKFDAIAKDKDKDLNRNDKYTKEGSRSGNRKSNYNRPKYSSGRDRHSKASSNYYDDRSKNRSHKSQDDLKNRSDRSYKDDSVRSRESQTKYSRSSHRSYSKKSDRGCSQEQSIKADKKSYNTKSSRSPGKRSPSKYPSCSTVKSENPVDDDIPNEDQYENKFEILFIYF